VARYAARTLRPVIGPSSEHWLGVRFATSSSPPHPVNDRDSLNIQARIQLLVEFRDLAQAWREMPSDDDDEDIRRDINKRLLPVRTAVIEAGAMKLVTIGPPPIVGGLVAQNIDPFRNFFEDFWGRSVSNIAVDCVDQAIGVYEQAQAGGGLGLGSTKEALDIRTAIERALRPAFRRRAPERETEVQDALETILGAVGVDFVRDKEVAPTGPRTSRPDFTIDQLDMAIEVKLAKPGHDASKVQEEINADITAYHTKWKHLLFVVYDLGAVDDPHAMVRENQKLFGVSVMIVKQ
jgi:hypothetical protein